MDGAFDSPYMAPYWDETEKYLRLYFCTATNDTTRVNNSGRSVLFLLEQKKVTMPSQFGFDSFVRVAGRAEREMRQNKDRSEKKTLTSRSNAQDNSRVTGERARQTLTDT